MSLVNWKIIKVNIALNGTATNVPYSIISLILKTEKPIFLDYPDNQLDKLPLLKYVKDLEKIIASYKPELIFTHSHSDLNIDHKIANSAVITATRPINTTVKAILFFETPSSTEWNFTNDKKFFKPNLSL